MTDMTSHRIASLALAVALLCAAFLAGTHMGTSTTYVPSSSYVPTYVQPIAEPMYVVDTDNTPAIVWDALISDGYTGSEDDHCECLYVPLSTVVDVPGGTWTLTIDGWVGCGDYSTTGTECTGHEYA